MAEIPESEEWALRSISLYEDVVCVEDSFRPKAEWMARTAAECVLDWAAPRLACGDLVVCWSVDWTGVTLATRDSM